MADLDEQKSAEEMAAKRAEHSESRKASQTGRAAPDENRQESTDSPATLSSPTITFLSVPYEEKDAAKALGARWHGKKQRWFAPEDADLSLFERWRMSKDTQQTATSDKGENPALEKPTINTLEKIDPIPTPETAPTAEPQSAPGAVVKTAPTPDPSPETTPDSRQSAPTIPEALNRYYRILGDTKKAQYFFQGQPDVEAFRDKGRKMTTKHDGPKIAQSMVELAEAKGWSNLKVSGSEQFRRSVWLAAQELDMAVTGYTPTTQDLENATLKNNTIESENSPTQAPVAQPEPEKAKAAGAQEAPLEAPPAAPSEPVSVDLDSTELSPEAGTTPVFTEPASEQAREYEDYAAAVANKRQKKQAEVATALYNSPGEKAARQRQPEYEEAREHADYANAVADKRQKKQVEVATALYNSPGEKAARQRQPEYEEECENATITRAADSRVNRQESVKAELDASPISYGLKATLRTAYLTLDKKEALAEFPQLKPVYAFEQAGKKFVTANKSQFSPGTDNKFVSRVRENALDVLARGKTLPDPLPPLSMPTKVPKNERSNDMELEL